MSHSKSPIKIEKSLNVRGFYKKLYYSKLFFTFVNKNFHSFYFNKKHLEKIKMFHFKNAFGVNE